MSRLSAHFAAIAAALVAGLLQAFSIASPWNGEPQWWLQLLSLALLAGTLQRQSDARAGFLTGWAFATAWLTATWWWLFISMHVYGGLAAPLAALAVVGLAAFLGLYYAAAAAVAVRLVQRAPWRDGILFAAAWTLAELLRNSWFTGFPWGAGGYAHVDGPLAFLAPWIGVYGIGAVAAWLAWLLARLVRREARGSWRYWAAAAGAAGLLAACNVAAERTPLPASGLPPLTVALLQGNIPQDEKFEGGSGIPFALAWYRKQLAQVNAALVVAPETALPLTPLQLGPYYLEALRASFADGKRAALVGIPIGSQEEGYTNSVIALNAGPSYQYDKHHLVPFGEFVPPLFKWFTRMMNIPLGDFNRGNVGQPSFRWQQQRLAPNICYEDLFGEELGARFRDENTAPTMFVNLSNIAWFGNTVAIDQHLHISRMRSLEFQRPMLRATNTGATVVIAATGRVTHALPRHTRGVLLGEAQGETHITPFAWWVARAGLWPLWALTLAIVLLAWAGRRR